MAPKRMLESKTDSPSKKRPTSFNDSWTREFPCITKSKEGVHFAFCTYCQTSFRINHGGRNDVTAHIGTIKHKDSASNRRANHSITKFAVKPLLASSLEMNTIRAETLFSVFIAEHNLPFAVSDHFTKLCKQMFPESSVAKNFSSGRTKTTQIIKRAVAPSFDKNVEELCHSRPFSILCDESNDRGNDKNLVILVRVFDDNLGKASTKFLDMPICNRATGENLFNTIDDVFKKRGLVWTNVVGYCSDNASVMVGRHNSVLSRIRIHQPAIFDLGCICHLANLCAGSAVRKIPVPVNDILVDIFYHFKHSSLRLENLRDFQDFTDTEHEKILKHVVTRWLSLEKCIVRTLSQWPALYSYFASHADVEKPGKVKTIASHLSNPETKLYFLFLEYILTPLNEFNITFQTDVAKIVHMDGEMRRLLRKFLGKFVRVQTIKEHPLTDVPYMSDECQLPDNLLAVGMSARLYITEEDIDPYIQKSFFHTVRQFYCAIVEKMLSKFPFNNPVLKNLLWLLPDESNRETATADSVATVAQHLQPSTNMDALQEEFIDYQLAEDLPKDQPTVDAFWYEVGLKKNVTGGVRFPLLTSLAKTVLSIPNSNADSERVFSMVKKIHTEQRDSLDNSTVVALLSTKINNDKDCFDTIFSEHILKDAKEATRNYNLSLQDKPVKEI